MFSSISKYSPKNLLAAYLSQSLAQFFNVDPTLVETNLIQDAKVVLNDIEIKERRLGGGTGDRSFLKVGGCIKQIEFSWVWDRKDLIKDLRLTVNGVHVHVHVISVTDEDDEQVKVSTLVTTDASEESPMESKEGTREEPPQDWKAKYLQQIIDHLTLAVTDVTVAIHLNDDEDSQVILHANDIELVTSPSEVTTGVGDITSSALMQMISLASVEIWIQQQGDDDDVSTNKFPILEPFGYQASVTRTSGRRFLDGVLSGLVVEGKSIIGNGPFHSALSAIRVHAGVRQIAGLNSLQRVLLAVGQDGGEGVMQSSGVAGLGESLPGNTKEGQKPNSSDATEAKKSSFRLPFQFMEVVLENNVALRLAACDVNYCTDGSELSISCSEGIWVNETPLSNDGLWILDLVSSELLLDSNQDLKSESDSFYSAHSNGDIQSETECQPDDVKPLRLSLSLDIFQKIYCGIQAIMPQCTEAMDLAENTMNQCTQPAPSSSPWSVKSTKPVSFRFTGKDGTWVDMLAKSPKLSGGSSVNKPITMFECNSIDVGSNAGFALHFPHISTDDTGCLLVECRAKATVDSLDTFQVLKNMWDQILDIIGNEPSGSGIPVSLAGFDVTFKEPQLSTLHLSHIKGSGIKWSIGLLQVHDVADVTLKATSLGVVLDESKTTMSVHQIERLAYKKVDYLAAPIVEATLEVNDELLSLAFKEVSLMHPEQVAAIKNNDIDSHEGSYTITMDFHLTVEHLKAESSTRGVTQIDGFNFWVRPMPESLMVDLELRNAKVRAEGVMELSCGKINSSVELNSAREDENNSTTLLPGLEQYSLSSASMKIHDVVQAQGTMGYLAKPLDIVEITCDGQISTIKCGKVSLCPKPEPIDQNSQRNGDAVFSLSLPIAVNFECLRLVIMKEFGPDKAGLCCDGIGLHLTPSKAGTDVKAQCKRAQGRGENGASFAIREVKLNLRHKNGTDDFLGLAEAHLSMKEVSTLSIIPGTFKFSLTKPICNAVIVLKNNAIEALCDSVHVSCAQMGEHAMGTEQDQNDSEFADIPVPFSIAVKQVVIDAPTSQVVCNQFSMQCRKTSASNSTSVHVGVKSFNGKFSTDSYKLDGISISTKWQVMGDHEHDIIVPYLGSLSFAQAEVEACPEMTTGLFSLLEPLNKSKLLYQEGFVVLELPEIQLNVAKETGDEDLQTQNMTSSKELNLDVIRVPIGMNSSKLRIKTPSFDVQLENIGIDYVRSSSSPQGEVFVHCDSLVESVMVSAKKLDLHLHMSLPFADPKKESRTMAKMIPGMDQVDKASLKIAEITDFVAEGKGRLSQPLHNTTVSYENGVVASNIESIQFECLCFEQRLAVGLRKLNVRIQSDPFDSTIRLMAQSDTVSGHGHVSFGATGVSLNTTLVPSSNEVLASKPIPVPSFGYVSAIVFGATEVTILSVQNIGHLKFPITKLALRFENESFTLDCPSLCFERRSRPTSMEVAPAVYSQGGSEFKLPCKASVSIGALQLCDPLDQLEVQCRSLNTTLAPMIVWAGGVKKSIQCHGLEIRASGSDLKTTEGSTVIDVPQLTLSGLLQLDNLSTVSNLVIGIQQAHLAAEFSSSSWSGSEAKEPSAVNRLPHAKISKFDLTLHYVGALLNISDAKLACGEFEGNTNTTLSQVGKHYIDVVKRRVPYLLAKTDIAGFNVADSVGVFAGKVITGTSAVGATVGIAGIDAVGSTLTMGKTSRGASSSDKYQFGDFSRGVVSSVKYAAKSGTEMRGDDGYQVGDFTKGTAKATGMYASENRCRLAGAGGSAAGMVAGLAIAGPIGLVAGSLMGGSAAKSSMAAIAGDPKKDHQRHLENAQDSPNQSNHTATKQSSSRAPDFFSSDSWSDHTELGSQRMSQQQRATGLSQRMSQQQRATGLAPVPSAHQNRLSGDDAQYPAYHSRYQASAPPAPTAALSGTNSDNDQHEHGYRFGDVTRGIVAKGKQADGRGDNSGYKFGDFTRGLFK